MALIGKHTSWTHHYIEWELPLAWGHALCCAFMRMKNINCEPASEKQELYNQIDGF